MSLYSIEDFKLFDSGTKLLNLLDGVVILSSSSSGKITDVQNQQLIEIHSEKKILAIFSFGKSRNYY